jgi:hypothetical protein
VLPGQEDDDHRASRERGQCRELGGEAGAQGVQFAGAVAFEAEHVLARLEDALDALADRREVRPSAGLVLAARADDQRVELGGLVFELAARVALVSRDGEPACARHAGQHVQADLALAGLGTGQRQRAWCAVGREQSVQAKAPEEPAVAGAVAVVGGVCQRASTHRLDRAPALDRGAVDDRQIVIETGAVTRELHDQRLDRVRQTLAGA